MAFLKAVLRSDPLYTENNTLYSINRVGDVTIDGAEPISMLEFLNETRLEHITQLFEQAIRNHP